MKKSVGLGLVAALFTTFGATNSYALPVCTTNDGWCCFSPITVACKSTCTEHNAVPSSSNCTPSGGKFATCALTGGTACVGRAELSEESSDQDVVTDDVSDAIGGEARGATNFWGYFNSTLKSPGSGVSSSCEAKIHVCFIHGFSDLSGVTDQTSCNNACNSATNTNQDECFDTDCSSRCGGWWSGTESCS